VGNYVSTIYDAAGNVSASVDQLGRRTTHSYDALNRETQVQDALGICRPLSTTPSGTSRFELTPSAIAPRQVDNLNQNTVTTDGTGATTTVSYDATGSATSTNRTAPRQRSLTTSSIKTP